MQAQDSASKRQATTRVWKVAAYFIGVVLVLRLSRTLFSMFNLESLSAFKKFSELVNQTANVTAKQDDLMVTGYSLLLTLLGVIPLGWVYTITKEDEGYDQSLVQTLVVLSLTVCGVMMML